MKYQVKYEIMQIGKGARGSESNWDEEEAEKGHIDCIDGTGNAKLAKTIDVEISCNGGQAFDFSARLIHGYETRKTVQW